jgi:hypothetical protein
MAKNDSNSNKPKVIGSVHYTKVHDYFDSVNDQNDISTLLFERQKNKFKEDLLIEYAGIYDRAFAAIEKWMKDIDTLQLPDKVIEQTVKGTNEVVEVEQREKGKGKKLSSLIEKYVKLCELFDEVNKDKGSTTANYKALEKFLKNNNA